ncbi:hypothetical protein OKA04_12455 [Luteolibacter flavescens]|uniref:Uncharacterized protein n=1 Tax=Luteolibacter flavescens TaxID=1859460 RepID=A0ABT3FPQ7_9BACT|nr:hypothetical protein [Luteolibacter flavescens]MCW1885543.1 hypothetical protein [Luteolibacter flavescens]
MDYNDHIRKSIARDEAKSAELMAQYEERRSRQKELRAEAEKAFTTIIAAELEKICSALNENGRMAQIKNRNTPGALEKVMLVAGLPDTRFQWLENSDVIHFLYPSAKSPTSPAKAVVLPLDKISAASVTEAIGRFVIAQYGEE